MSTITITTGARPAVGSAAPDFTLKSTSGAEVTLSAFRGTKHVLLAFFPLAFTSTCTAELCAFSDDWDAFLGKDVEVLPISVDSVPVLKEFKAKYQMKVDLVSDFKRQAAAAYDVLFGDTFFTSRAYFLIDKQGIVRWSHVEKVLGEKREDSEILAEIAKLG
jgi:peroxiredoxin